MLSTVEREVTITLDGEPRGKGRPQFSRKSGTAFTPGKTRAYEAALRWAGQEAMVGRYPMGCPLDVTIIARFPIAASWPKWKQAAAVSGALRPTTKPDLDNIMKMLDALNGVVFNDDCQIVSAYTVKVYSEKPSLEILIRPLRQAVKP